MKLRFICAEDIVLMTHATETSITPSVAQAMRRISSVTLLVASILVVLKGWGWWRTDSVALLGSLLDSCGDFFISFINFFVIRRSLRPASNVYRFGQSKTEPLAALAQSLVIAGSAIVLIWESYWNWLTPVAVPYGALGMGIIGVSIVLTYSLVVVQQRIARHTGSLAVAAEHAHYRGDVIMNLGVMVAIGLASYTPLQRADALLGFVVAAILLHSAATILGGAWVQLMDRELPEATRQRIRKLVLAHPKVVGMHDLRTRAAGVRSFIQCHIEMDGAMSLYDAHTIADEVEARLLKAFPNAEIIIHQDPAGEEKIADMQK